MPQVGIISRQLDLAKFPTLSKKTYALIKVRNHGRLAPG